MSTAIYLIGGMLVASGHWAVGFAMIFGCAYCDEFLFDKRR